MTWLLWVAGALVVGSVVLVWRIIVSRAVHLWGIDYPWGSTRHAGRRGSE